MRAFPNDADKDLWGGMTMRQWYKGQILAGADMLECAEVAYAKVIESIGKIADAMIAEDEEHDIDTIIDYPMKGE